MSNGIEDIAPYDDEHLGFKEAAEELKVSEREIARLIFIGNLPHTREIVFPWTLKDIYANRENIFFQRRQIEEYREDPGFYKALKAINPAEWFPNTDFSKASESATISSPGKPGPQGPHSRTIRRRADINALEKEGIREKKPWETKTCMRLNDMKTPFPSKRLEMIYRCNWISWLREDRMAFLKQWSKDINSE